MAQWIHCNKCTRPFDMKVPFYIGECAHLECQHCLKAPNLNEGQCSVCNKICKRILLAKDMRPDAQLYFKPFADILNQAKQVYDFQEKQRNFLLNQLSTKYAYAKKEVLKYQKIIESQRKDIFKLKSMLQQPRQPPSGRNLQQVPSSTRCFLTSTPMSKNGVDMNLSVSTVGNHNIKMGNFTPYVPRPGYVKRIPSNVNTPQNQTFATPATSSSVHVVPAASSSAASSIMRSHRNNSSSMFSPMVHLPNNYRSRFK